MILLSSSLRIGLASLCALVLVDGADSAPAKPKLTALNFFETMTPAHPRNPEWPARLTFRRETSVTKEDVLRLLTETRWRTGYQCMGQAVDASWSDGVYDGMTNGYLDLTFSRTDVTKTFTFPADVERHHEDGDDRTESVRYEVNDPVDGMFTMKFLGVIYAQQTLFVVTVNETGERMLVRDFDHNVGDCSIIQPSGVLFVPLPDTSF